MKFNYLTKIVCWFISFVLLITSFSMSDDNVDKDDQEYNKLMSILEKYSDLATKTRMNADYVPGILTVITRNEMEIIPARTVKDVLETISGVNIYIDQLGVRNISIRSLGSSIGAGNVKLMVNNISVIDSISSLFDLILDYPVELLECIEVIRGPGSAIYGEYAYSGIINVITKKNNSILSFGIGSLQSFYANALLNYNNPNNSCKINALVYKYNTDGSDSVVGPDAYHSQSPEMKAASNTPGPTNERQTGKFALLSIDYKKFSCQANISEVQRGDFMGFYYYIENRREDTPYQISQKNLEFSQKINFYDLLQADIKAGFTQNKLIFDDFVLYPLGHPFFPSGFFADGNSKANKQYAGLDLKTKYSKNHKFLFGIEYFIDDYAFIGEYKYIPDIIYNTKRRVFSFASQYEAYLGDSFSFTLGLRSDNYFDSFDDKKNYKENNISPRISAVYRLNTDHIFKLQYASAFRPPTFQEQNNSNDFQAPTIKTYEMSYLNKNSNSKKRISLYYSKLDNMVEMLADGFTYSNAEETIARGVEVELEHKFWYNFKLNTNASYMYSNNRENDNPLPLQPKFIANATITNNPIHNLHLSLQYRYVGNCSRETIDTRKWLSAYHKVNGIMIINIPTVHMKVKIGIHNLLNGDIKVSTPIGHLMPPKFTIPGDYPLPGRMMWFNIVYEL